MAAPVIYGPDYSTYVRTVRLVFAEKPADCRLEPVHLLGGEASQPDFLKRQPFGKVPAFEHDGFTLYETSAIVRYVDQVFPGQRLQPAEARAAARMNQIISIVDSYAYGAILGKLVWQRLIEPMLGRSCDEAVIRDAMPMVVKSLAALESLKGEGDFLVGHEVTLADLYLAPVFAYFSMTPDMAELMKPCPGLMRWWEGMAQRPSMQATQPKLG